VQKISVGNKVFTLPGWLATRAFLHASTSAFRAKIDLEEKRKKLLADPFGHVAKKQQAAAILIQKIVRGWMTRRRARVEAAITIQRIFRARKAYSIYLETLFFATVKYYDSKGGYYYVSPFGTSWKPPAQLKDRYIPYGRRRRKRPHEWGREEAIICIQAAWRAYTTRKRFIEHVRQSFEKVYEPSRGKFFLQNIYTGKCRWDNPFNLDLWPDPEIPHVFHHVSLEQPSESSLDQDTDSFALFLSARLSARSSRRAGWHR
jgi:hypothetical protein